ncbi:MAG: squalene/phytoene synthase family protein [Rikenellaceae bacterium]
MVASNVLVASEQLPANDKMKELIETVAKFHIPVWPLQAFAKSMIYDIYNDGFPTLEAFLDYAAGAYVTPAAIFVHLCGLKKVNGTYQAPAFDVKNAAASCAIFSYLVHIIRDFVKDHTHNLNYFPHDLMRKNNLSTAKNCLRWHKVQKFPGDSEA